MTPEKIKKFRIDRFKSQEALAAALGVDQATVSRIENGAEIKGPAKILLEKLMAEPESERLAS
ncbi:helix-turn-helix transcriptional regulator [Mesorhizobium sp.]|uniref:helix-turn-helix domain-containing protein n=1 Tax=Mesorhizobium sp. TaxID=1871066 RepID=UPI000FE6E1E4|nr:helix-turn-helix transcriptional regulator [Mesorhizobium sp.]RWO22843.1 MAG: XRE family transcriptional regulator [Mesorhizobium sp.]